MNLFDESRPFFSLVFLVVFFLIGVEGTTNTKPRTKRHFFVPSSLLGCAYYASCRYQENFSIISISPTLQLISMTFQNLLNSLSLHQFLHLDNFKLHHLIQVLFCHLILNPSVLTFPQDLQPRTCFPPSLSFPLPPSPSPSPWFTCLTSGAFTPAGASGSGRELGGIRLGFHGL